MHGFEEVYGDKRVQEEVYEIWKEKYDDITVLNPKKYKGKTSY